MKRRFAILRIYINQKIKSSVANVIECTTANEYYMQ